MDLNKVVTVLRCSRAFEIVDEIIVVFRNFMCGKIFANGAKVLGLNIVYENDSIYLLLESV